MSRFQHELGIAPHQWVLEPETNIGGSKHRRIVPKHGKEHRRLRNSTSRSLQKTGPAPNSVSKVLQKSRAASEAAIYDLHLTLD